jgi:hypothetical protein
MTAHAQRMHATSGGAGRTQAGTTDVDRRRHRWRRDNPIADILGEQQRDNLTADVGPLSGVGRTAATLPPAGGGRVFFVVPPTATVLQADAAKDNNDNSGKGGHRGGVAA